MARVLDLYRSSVGKKMVMAGTGTILLLFVITHMLGNLKIYYGEEKYNHYAEWLRVMGAPIFARSQALWLSRSVLLACVVLHVLAAMQTTIQSWAAREQPYYLRKDIAFSYASSTMRWGGVIIFGFVVYHLLDLTLGTVHPGGLQEDSVYHNVVGGFQRWPVSLAYVLAMIPLGLHIYHGLWSALQTLGVNNPAHNTWRRPLAGLVAGAIVIGNISIPVAVLAGVVK